MQPESDGAAAKRLVRRGYDQCGAAYSAARRQKAAPELALVSDRLAAGARVLDLGCGAGVPVARTLAARCAVTGVDISGEQIRRARANVPTATFIHSDMMDLAFAPESFDAVVSFYAIFHLPREEHPELLQRIATWLVPGGYFLATFAYDSEAGYTEEGFYGATMYWSNYGLADYQQLLVANGFALLDTRTLGHGYEDHSDSGERHPLVFARKGER